MDGSITFQTVAFAGVIVTVTVFLFLQLAQLHGRITRAREDAKTDCHLLRVDLDGFKLEVAKQYPSSDLIVELNGSIRDLTKTMRDEGVHRPVRRK